MKRPLGWHPLSLRTLAEISFPVRPAVLFAVEAVLKFFHEQEIHVI